MSVCCPARTGGVLEVAQHPHMPERGEMRQQNPGEAFIGSNTTGRMRLAGASRKRGGWESASSSDSRLWCLNLRVVCSLFAFESRVSFAARWRRLKRGVVCTADTPLSSMFPSSVYILPSNSHPAPRRCALRHCLRPGKSPPLPSVRANSQPLPLTHTHTFCFPAPASCSAPTPTTLNTSSHTYAGPPGDDRDRPPQRARGHGGRGRDDGQGQHAAPRALLDAHVRRAAGSRIGAVVPVRGGLHVAAAGGSGLRGGLHGVDCVCGAAA
eukprot:354338-Chlamydomonas_euryale.AAC.1